MSEDWKMDRDHSEIRKGDQDGDSTWAALCHFSAILGLIWWIPAKTGVWIPFGHLMGPLAVWLIMKKKSSFINDAGKESLNFQIMMTVYGLILNLILLPVELNLIPLLVITDLALVVTAGLKTSKGEVYRYPFIPLRLIR